MSVDLFKKYVIKFDYNSFSTGSGVIFKPSKKSDTVYLITAKHNFFDQQDPGNSFDKYTEIFIDVSNDSIYMMLAVNPDEFVKIRLKNNKFYFLNNPYYDVAYAIIDWKQVPEIDINYVYPLEVLDCQNENLEKLNYYSIGYPSGAATNSSISGMANFHLQYSNEEDKNLVTKFLSRNPSFFTNTNTQTYISGFSGSGVFVKQKEGLSCLSHIQFNAFGTNLLYATRLDMLLDEINDRVKENFPEDDLINLQSYVTLGDDKLDFTEYSDLEFLKEKIRNELPSYQRELKNLFPNKDSFNEKIDDVINKAISKNSDSIDQETLRFLIPYLRNKHNEIINQTKGLSYIYAYLAVASENYSATTRTSLFKKAISLNSEHQQTFLLQKQKNAGNTEAMRRVAENSLSGTIIFYDQLIAEEKNDLIRLRLIEEGMQKVYDFNSNNDVFLRRKTIQNYLKQLEFTLRQSTMVREFYKYISLGDNYLSFGEIKEVDTHLEFKDSREVALYFYQIAIHILEKSSRSESDHETLNFLKEKYLKIEEDCAVSLSEHQYKQAIEEANSILINKEDKELKASVSEVKQMMFAIHEELINIKAQSQNQSNALENLEMQLTGLSDDSFQKDQIIDFNIYEANRHISLLADSTKNIKEYTDNISKNYELTLNNEFKQDISSLIQDQVSKNIDNLLNPLIDLVNKNSEKLTHSIEDFASNAEKSMAAINALSAQEIKESEENLRQLTATFTKDASDKIAYFKEEALEFNRLITEKIMSLTRAQDVSNEEKQVIMESLRNTQMFFDSRAKTIHLKAGSIDIDLGNYIRIMAGDLSGLIDTQNRNFISLAKSLLRNDQKQSGEASIQATTTLPEATALELNHMKAENVVTIPKPPNQKASNKQKLMIRFMKALMLLIFLALIISGIALMNKGT